MYVLEPLRIFQSLTKAKKITYLFTEQQQIQEFILLHIERCSQYALTFFENMFWREKPQVDTRAATRPSMSKDNSVMLAMATPRMIGTREKYT